MSHLYLPGSSTGRMSLVSHGTHCQVVPLFLLVVLASTCFGLLAGGTFSLILHPYAACFRTCSCCPVSLSSGPYRPRSSSISCSSPSGGCIRAGKAISLLCLAVLVVLTLLEFPTTGQVPGLVFDAKLIRSLPYFLWESCLDNCTGAVAGPLYLKRNVFIVALLLLPLMYPASTQP